MRKLTLKTVIRTLELLVAAVSLVMVFVVLLLEGDDRLRWLAIGLTVVAVGLLIANTIGNWRMERLQKDKRAATRWSTASRGIADVTLQIAGLHRLDPAQAGGTVALSAAKDACKEFAIALAQVTGDRVRVTLQEIYAVGGEVPELAARTIVFPSGSVRGDDAGPDYVAENTDFDDILSQGKDFFHSHDLVRELKRGYRNSHWTRAKLKAWAQDGEYPYRSTLVWPVRGQPLDPRPGGPVWDTVGFICADTRSRRAFDPRYDVPIGEIVGRALYGAWPSIVGPENGVPHVQPVATED